MGKPCCSQQDSLVLLPSLAQPRAALPPLLLAHPRHYHALRCGEQTVLDDSLGRQEEVTALVVVRHVRGALNKSVGFFLLESKDL